MFNDKNVSFVTRQKLWDFYNSKLSKAVDVGYSPDLQFYDEDLAKSLKENIAEFSAFKETAFKKDVESLLTDGKHLRKKSDFKQEALKVSDDYNYRWLETERHQTIANTQMAAKWKDFERNVELYPNIKLVSVHDSRVRPEHKILDGTIRPYNDPFWKTHTPPLDWGCRCDIEQTDEEPTTIPGGFQTKIEFENNPADSGKIFGGSAYEERLNTDEKEEARENAITWRDYDVLEKNELFEVNKKNLTEDKRNAFPGLDLDQSNSINLYSSNHYSEINAFNRGIGNVINDDFSKEYYEAITRTINKGLDEIPDKYVGEVYRSADLNSKHLESYKKAFESGKPHIEKGFMSTSYDREVAEDFGGNVNFVIKSKNGTVVEKLSNLPHEKEVLFKTNQEFKVTDFIDYGGAAEIHLEEI